MKTIPEFDLDRFLPYRLNRVSEWTSRQFSMVYRSKYGMTRPEWRVLAILGQRGRLTARMICDLTSQHKTKVSRAVASLERRRWLARRENESDRREAWLQLTAEGRLAFADLSARGTEFEARFRSMLSIEEIQAIEKGLTALETLAASEPDGLATLP